MANPALITDTLTLELPAALELRSRDRLERLIEQLIGLLDRLDGDEYLEPDSDSEEGGDDEPSIGEGLWGYGVDYELDESDAEPSLGWTGSEAQTGFYGSSGVADREIDDSDDEEGGDDEPCLSWTDAEAAGGLFRNWSDGDDELDPCDDEQDHRDLPGVPMTGYAVA